VAAHSEACGSAYGGGGREPEIFLFTTRGSPVQLLAAKRGAAVLSRARESGGGGDGREGRASLGASERSDPKFYFSGCLLYA